MRKCLKCKETKSLDSFYISGNYPQSYCKPCQNAFAKIWREKNKEHVREQKRKRHQAKTPEQKREAHYKRRYGITIADFDRMEKEQDYGCAICGKSCERRGILSVDHCHETGRVRGLLCDGCNNILGRAKDNAELLRKASDYLESGWIGK